MYLKRLSENCKREPQGNTDLIKLIIEKDKGTELE